MGGEGFLAQSPPPTHPSPLAAAARCGARSALTLTIRAAHFPDCAHRTPRFF